LAAFQTGQGLQLFEQAQLSDIDTAYAITVHKSQGSEYDTVVVILPPVDSPLVSRELVYTAVTRAKQRVFTIGTAAAMIACLDTPARRMTGLTEALTT
jgi:exodeoxyribonuclease V alpha subunit